MKESVVLLPYPQELSWTDDWYDLNGGHDLGSLPVRRILDAAIVHEQGYELSIKPEEISMRAKSDKGLLTMSTKIVPGPIANTGMQRLAGFRKARCNA